MTRHIDLARADSRARRDLVVDYTAAWRPRPADETDALPDPRRTRHAEALVEQGRALDALKAERWHAAQQPHPARRMIGPAMAARLGVDPTTPPL